MSEDGEKAPLFSDDQFEAIAQVVRGMFGDKYGLDLCRRSQSGNLSPLQPGVSRPYAAPAHSPRIAIIEVSTEIDDQLGRICDKHEAVQAAKARSAKTEAEKRRKLESAEPIAMPPRMRAPSAVVLRPAERQARPIDARIFERAARSILHTDPYLATGDGAKDKELLQQALVVLSWMTTCFITAVPDPSVTIQSWCIRFESWASAQGYELRNVPVAAFILAAKVGNIRCDHPAGSASGNVYLGLNEFTGQAMAPLDGRAA